MTSTEKAAGYRIPNVTEFDMTSYNANHHRPAALALAVLSTALALAVPQMIASAALPRPGTMRSFLVWF